MRVKIDVPPRNVHVAPTTIPAQMLIYSQQNRVISHAACHYRWEEVEEHAPQNIPKHKKDLAS